MKYAVILLDGMADSPLEELSGKTPLEAAQKPNMNDLARTSELGFLKVTPDGCKGGSEVGNLSLLGYDPRVCLTGRSPIEAASIGISLADDDLALRCNFVHLSEGGAYEQKTMDDYSAGEISTAEADALVGALNDAFGGKDCRFYTGISYRHCLVLSGTGENMTLTPPHNIAGRVIKDFLPRGDEEMRLRDMMKKSYAILHDHPVNVARRAAGKNAADSVWFWGQGRRMSLPSFEERFGVKAAMVTAVDLLRGIGRCAGMRTCFVQGATGTVETNFAGKAEAAVAAWKTGCDFVYIHLEAADECGHHGDAEGKRRAAEEIDRHILAPVMRYLYATGEPFRVLITPDHPTPAGTRAHSSDDVPYLLYDSTQKQHGAATYDETSCRAAGNYRADVLSLMNEFIKS